MAVWKQAKNEWLNGWVEKFMNFNSELDSATNIFSDEDKEKLKAKMTSIRLMFNRYAKND